MGAHSAQYWNCLILIFNSGGKDAIEVVYRVVFECLPMFVNNKKFSKKYEFDLRVTLLSVALEISSR